MNTPTTGSPLIRCCREASPVTAATRDRYAKGVALCVAATVLMGIMFPVMTHALTHIDPFTFTSLRYLIAGVAFLALLLAKEGRHAMRADGESIALA
jgi:drug/metabolite transporter (DMT)-like permease